MNQHLWLIWRNPESRLRYKVGILTYDGKRYFFEYTNPELDNASETGFTYFPGFSRKEKYTSDELFPSIKDRLPNPSRPDYLDMLNEYDLSGDASDWDILTATKGRLVTDDYEFVRPFTEKKVEFDVAGTRHREDYAQFKDILSTNDKVELVPEPTNEFDKNAIKVCLADADHQVHLGYVPKFYSKELSDLLKSGKKYSARVKKIQFGGDTHDNDITAEVQLIF